MKPLDSDREYAVQLLSAHYANGSLTTKELEARFERVYEAEDTGALHTLVSGLPMLPAALGQPLGMWAPGPSSAPPPEKRVFALMSEYKRRGEWTPAQRNVIRVIMGSATIDLRHAHLALGVVTEFEVFACMAEILFILPPGISVECDGMPIMGSFDDSGSRDYIAADAPRIRITGTAMMGGVKIRTRLPGESALAAWRRQLADRKR
ncbi:MAG: DUF1707 and DUF2154 domain-containing protein [Gemmatimonadaceae bacterium]|nr:DUF1707 and DUF2154 domain-containing protein [Gemmatimonadaceae bacterium]